MRAEVTAAILLALASNASFAAPQTREALDAETKYRLMKASEALSDNAIAVARRSPNIDASVVMGVANDISTSTEVADMIRRHCVDQYADRLITWDKDKVSPAIQEKTMNLLIGMCTKNIAVTTQGLLKDAYPQ